MIKNSLMKKIAIFACIVSMFTNVASAETGFSTVEEVNSSVISLPQNGVKGQVSVESIKGVTVYNYADNGTDYVNWLINGTGTTKGASGIHLQQASSSEYAKLSTNLKTSTQYTVILNIKDKSISAGNLKIVGGTGNIVSDDTSVFIHSDSLGISKTLITTNSSITENEIEFKVTSAIDGEYVEFELYAILEGDYTADSSVDKSFKFGVNSTLPVRIKAETQNRFDNTTTVSGEYYGSTGNVVEHANSVRSTQLIKINPSLTYYSNKNIGILTFDADRNFIERPYSSGYATHNFNDNVNYVQLHRYDGGIDYFDDLQFSHINDFTSANKYDYSTIYINLPDGVVLRALYDSTGNLVVYDEISGNTLYKRTEETTFNSWVEGTHLTNHYRFDNDCLSNHYFDANGSGKYNLSLGSKQWSYAYDTNDNEHFYAVSDGRLLVYIEKSKVDAMSGATLLEKWNDYLIQNIPSCIYQLATEQITDIPTTPLIGYPNGTIIIEPAISEGGIYDGSITINNSDLPIESIESVKRINSDSTRTMIDLSNITIASDGKSFTITGASEGESYEYEYMYPQGLATIPTISYSVPIDQNGQISGNTNMIQQNSELIDLILQEIQLLRDEINTME